MNPTSGDQDRVVWQRERNAVAVRAMRDAAHEHRVDVEFEAQRQHDPTVAPRLGHRQDTNRGASRVG
jgi:hypothetical protein